MCLIFVLLVPQLCTAQGNTIVIVGYNFLLFLYSSQTGGKQSTKPKAQAPKAGNKKTAVTKTSGSKATKSKG